MVPDLTAITLDYPGVVKVWVLTGAVYMKKHVCVCFCTEPGAGRNGLSSLCSKHSMGCNVKHAAVSSLLRLLQLSLAGHLP